MPMHAPSFTPAYVITAADANVSCFQHFLCVTRERKWLDCAVLPLVTCVGHSIAMPVASSRLRLMGCCSFWGYMGSCQWHYTLYICKPRVLGAAAASLGSHRGLILSSCTRSASLTQDASYDTLPPGMRGRGRPRVPPALLGGLVFKAVPADVTRHDHCSSSSSAPRHRRQALLMTCS